MNNGKTPIALWLVFWKNILILIFEISQERDHNSSFKRFYISKTV